MGQLSPYVRRVEEVLNLEVEEETGREAPPVEVVKLEEVSVEVDGRAVVKRTDAEFKRGGIYAVVGPSGSGKTTLLLTLARVYTPSKGRVLINGVDYREFFVASLRRRVLYVGQTPFLFRGTLRENVALGLDAPPEAIKKALEAAAIDFAGLGDEIDADKLSDRGRGWPSPEPSS
ncbi:ATP-binding cassette domain-containing protein [Pyrobaculum islandicum]|uniref:ATP-binding cassette domain-containing protein n=1 Tax=Pyrobaculum islandicum TaxID=2277 RepID=UPI00069FD50C|nr:ATP-binding cassette domain-containing protein [Pyrobaculum islandicum]